MIESLDHSASKIISNATIWTPMNLADNEDEIMYSMLIEIMNVTVPD